jgi:hypothetical protein
MIYRDPRNLKTVPNSSSEGTIEEQLSSVLEGSSMTKDAIIIISDMPMPSHKHILCIDPVM